MPAGPYGAPILDTMVRADESPVSGGGNWPDRVNDQSNLNDPQIISNQCTTVTSWGTRYWLTNFSGSVEAGCKIAAKPGSGGYAQSMIIFTRLQNVATSAPDGYQLIYTPYSAGADVLQIFRMDNGGHTQLGSNVDQEVSVGDALALVSIGDEHSIWYHNGSTWTSLLTETDAAYSSGYTGVELSNTSFAFIDWFAGDTSSGQVLSPSADSVDGAWTNQAGGTTLAASIDEATFDDADYIRSEVNPSASGCRVKLEAGGDPNVSTGHHVDWRTGKLGSATINMTVKVYQGGGDSLGAGTLIASFARNNVGSLTNYSETLSGAEADSITDYTDLYLEFFADTA